MNYGGSDGRGMDPGLRREQAEQEAWARQNAYQPNIPPRYDGYWGSEPPQPPMPDWQRGGYHMEDAPCDDEEPVDDTNDGDFDLPDGDMDAPSAPDVDPMGNTGVDRRLEEQRSRTVREHLGEFWKRVRRPGPESGAEPDAVNGAIPPMDGPGLAGDPMGKGAPGGVPMGDSGLSGPVPAAQIHPGGRTLVWVLAAVTVLVAVGIMVGTELFRISSITVTGNSRISTQEIISLSGVKVGSSVLTLNEAQIAENIARNRYLKLVCVSHDNHRVTLQVYEREPAAYTSVRGYFYTMDIRGMVLEEYSSDTDLKHLIYVQNMNVHSCIRGKHIDLYDRGVMDVYLQLMLEFKAMSLTDTVKELYLEDLDSISLTTASGFYVRLGDETCLHQKLRSMMLTLAELERMGYVGGTVDVSVFTKPSYRPEQVTDIAG